MTFLESEFVNDVTYTELEEDILSMLESEEVEQIDEE